MLHNSDNNRNNQSPLVVPNEYGSNLNILEVGLDGFHQFYKDTGLDLVAVLAQVPYAPEVDPYRKYKQGQSLYNPKKLGELGTQMYLLNQWYMEASKGRQIFLSVRIRNQHYFCGNNIIYVEFPELHQLCHLDSLDVVSLVSIACKSISKGFGKLTWHLLLFANSHNKIQRIKIGHLQGNWHLDLAKDKNRRSPGTRAFLAYDFARAIGFAKLSTTWHFCQVCSLICQVAQIANSKCKTVGYLFWRFLANYSNAKPLEML